MLLCYHMEIDVPKALTSDECLTADERLRKIAEGRAFIGEAKISLWIFLALESAFLIIYRILWPDLDPVRDKPRRSGRGRIARTA